MTTSSREGEIEKRHAETSVFLLTRGKSAPECHEDRGYLLSRIKSLEEQLAALDAISPEAKP